LQRRLRLNKKQSKLTDELVSALPKYQPQLPLLELNNTINNKQSKLTDESITNILCSLNEAVSPFSQPDLNSQLSM
ncbi:33178_t:CDS:1, partial [Gigaspora margarita]